MPCCDCTSQSCEYSSAILILGDKMFNSYSSCSKLDLHLLRKKGQSVNVDYQHVVKTATNDTNCE